METDDCSNLDTEIVHTTLDVINSLTSSSAILTFLCSPGTSKKENFSYCNSYVNSKFIPEIIRYSAVETIGNKYSVCRH